jgi:recombination protein RecR
MAQYNVAPLENLVDQFEKMPGIGHKTAQRLAYYVLNLSKTEADALAKAVTDAHSKIHYCSRCCNLTDRELCPVCASPARDHGVICVVETPRDATAVENTHEFKGVYHVLHGAISPLNDIGPDNLTIKELLKRLSDSEVSEVIMATNPTVEGDATALYISKLLKPMGVKVTRLAY